MSLPWRSLFGCVPARGRIRQESLHVGSVTTLKEALHLWLAVPKGVEGVETVETSCMSCLEQSLEF